MSYGDYYCRVRETHHTIPEPQSVIGRRQSQKVDLKYPSKGGTNLTLFLKKPLTIKGGEEINYAAGQFNISQGYHTSSGARFRCLYRSTDSLDQAEFLFNVGDGQWRLGYYENEKACFIVPVSFSKRYEIKVDGTISEINVDASIYEADLTITTTQNSLENVKPIASNDNRYKCFAVAALALALILGIGGGVALGLKLGSVVSQTYFFYIGGGLLGAAFISLALSGLTHWRRRSINHLQIL